MSLRPMDIQTVMPKVQEINSAKQNVVNKVDNELANIQLTNNDESKEKLNKVSELNQKEHDAVDRDGKGDSSGGQSKAQKRKEEQEEADKIEDELTGLGTRFDMRI